MKDNYKYLKWAYKTFSPYGKNRYFCLNLISFSDLILNCKITNEDYKMNAADLCFITTYSGKATDRYKISPYKCLIRFELLECILRLGKDKYIRTG